MINMECTCDFCGRRKMYLSDVDPGLLMFYFLENLKTLGWVAVNPDPEDPEGKDRLMCRLCREVEE